MVMLFRVGYQLVELLNGQLLVFAKRNLLSGDRAVPAFCLLSEERL
jgi:hypothetical protein